MKKTIVSLFALSIVFAGNTIAQETQGKFELSPFAGIHITEDYVGGVGSVGPEPDPAPLAGLRLGYFLTEAFHIEFSGQRAFGQTGNFAPYFGEDIDMDNLNINVAYHFLTGALRPYVSAGAGYAHIDSNNLNSSHDLGVNGGLGFRLFAGDSAGIRIEGKYAPVNYRTDWKQNFDVTGGLFFLFGKKGNMAAPVVEEEEIKVVDSDGDGVSDDVDACPSTPSGTQVNAEGCPAETEEVKVMDADGDGVVDADDKCPTTPAGAPVDAMGCALDSDGDGVKDFADRCPDTASGTEVDTNGCPVKSVARGVLSGVNFVSNSDQLADVAGASKILDDVAAELLKFPDVKVEVQGHTDSMGDPDYNMGLSEKRAEAVVSHLVTRGVDPAQLSSRGYGITSPIADNGNSKGRAQNRRVELNWLD